MSLIYMPHSLVHLGSGTSSVLSRSFSAKIHASDTAVTGFSTTGLSTLGYRASNRFYATVSMVATAQDQNGFLKSTFPVDFPSHIALTYSATDFEAFLKKEVEKFSKAANTVKTVSHKSEFLLAIAIGLFRFLMFMFYVYAFWIGTTIVQKGWINQVTD